jgi:uncharacterized membrane protein (UPF0127 family)
MKIKVLRTPEERDIGLQHLPRIPDDTIYVFVGPFIAGQFHSRNVPEPFDLVFLSSKLDLISKHRLVPPNDVVPVNFDATYALEAKPGVLDMFIV